MVRFLQCLRERLRGLIEGRGEWLLLGIGLAVFLVHAVSVGYYPMCWYDEVEMIEAGRRTLFSDDGWSACMVSLKDGGLVMPLPWLHYLSPSIQELFCRLGGGFTLARLFFLLSLPVCAIAMFRWLRAKESVTVSAAFFAAVVFMLDPNATICAHWYRPDLWALTILFLALVQVSRKRFFVAGMLSVLMLFFWLTSALLLPLVLLEAYETSENRGRDLVSGIAGGLVAGVILLLPICWKLPEIIAHYQNNSEMGTSAGLGFSVDKLVDFVKIAVRSPFVWLGAVFGACFGRRFALHALLFAALVVFMLGTRVYHLRMVYLLPFLFLFLTVAVQKSRGLVQLGFVAAAPVAYFMISVVVLEYAALPSGDNSLGNLVAGFKAAVPQENARVYMVDNEHELYWAGRELGWKMFGASDYEAAFREDISRRFLDQVDAVAVAELKKYEVTEADLAYLRRCGFVHKHEIRFSRKVTGLREKLVAFFYTSGYPDVTVYSKNRGRSSSSAFDSEDRFGAGGVRIDGAKWFW